MTMMYKNGIDYFNGLGLVNDAFTPEEKERICGFYEKSRMRDYGIYPINKSAFDDMQKWSREFLPDVCLLWTNDHSNYAGVYLAGPLRGKVCIIDHEEEMYAPVFRSIKTFIAAILSHQLNDLHNQSILKSKGLDYPALNASPAEKEADLAIARALIKALDDVPETDYYQSGMAVCYLMPDTHLDLLKPFLYQDNMWVQEVACGVLAIHQYAPAEAWLKEISQTGKGNALLAAEQALRYMKKASFLKGAAPVAGE